jgi:voltage-gated potassium channel Kch
MRRRATLGERLRYAFDNTLSHGPIALVAWLALATAFVVVLTTFGYLILAGTSGQFGPQQVFWSILYQALTPNPVDPTLPRTFLLLMLFVTVFSLLMVSLLIGILNAAIDNRVQALRRGRSRVVESGHTVILGWSEQVFTIVSELAIANENQPHSSIIILGDKDRVDMEDELRHKVGRTGRTRVVCRSGDPIEYSSLDIVSIQEARSIIVISPDTAHPDASVVKTLLAITNAPDRRREPYQIVAELQNPRNLYAARLAGGEEAELVLAGDVIARIMAQTCRRTGLSLVLTELLNFEGDEIYFQEEPGLIGKTFGEALFAYEDSAVIGLCPRDGAPTLNPPMDTCIQPGDSIIAISEDDDTVILSGLGRPAIQMDAVRELEHAPNMPERALILGWNWRAPAVIDVLDNYVAPGSSVTVVAIDPDGEVARACASLHPVRQTLEFHGGDTTDRSTLDALAIETYQHVILLCYCDNLSAQDADARTIVTLLHLRSIAEHTGHPFSVVSEMLDARNRNLAEIAHPDDFIVSDQLVSLLLAQISENRHLREVFDNLLAPAGSEIYLKPAADYVQSGVSVNFYTVVEAARRRGEVAFGYRQMAAEADQARNYGVVVNPDKSQPIVFEQMDRIIVLAEG